MTVLTMIQSVRCVNSKRTMEAISWSICVIVQRSRIRLGTPVWVCTNLPGLIRSFAETGEDLHLHFDSARRVAEAAVDSAIAGFPDWIGATMGRYFLHHVVNAVNWKPGKSGPQES